MQGILWVVSGVCVCVHVCVYIYVYRSMCVCVCIYIYVLVYIQRSKQVGKLFLGCNYGRIIPPTPNSGSEGFCLQMDGQVLLQWLKILQEAPNSL